MTDLTVDWHASAIAPASGTGSAPLLRCVFDLERPLAEMRSATLSATAWGVTELWLNGRPVSPDLLEPGWSSYPWRLRYRTYDVMGLLRERSVLAAILGNGWFRGRLGWTGARAVYGDQLTLLAQLDIVFSDGHRQRVVTDETWEATASQVLQDDLYDGQTVDLRLPGLAEACVEEALLPWGPVTVVDQDLTVLVPATAPPVRRIEGVPPVELITLADGRYVVDFGQNVVGWVRAEVTGPAGHEVLLRHSEVLQDGELALRPLRSARAQDRYLLSGADDVLEPTLTFHGFRYVELTGWPGELRPEQLSAVVVHSDLEKTGTFRCSEELLNRFHDNVVWSTRGNFLALPTDCPQRDERLGWTGDISVYAPTAAYLFDVQSFLADWLADLRVEQQSQGRVPLVVPDLLSRLGPDVQLGVDATAVWGDAAVWVPWALWQAYGDRELLRAHYPSMADHVRHVLGLRSERGLVDASRQLGDWLDPDAPPDMPWQAKADPGVVATACLYRSTVLTAEAAEALGLSGESASLRHAAHEVRGAFRQHYVDASGLVRSDCVTVYALAIAFGLLAGDELIAAGARLARLVEDAGYRTTTGFAGTPFVCDALTSCGYVEHAYQLLLCRTSPSWLHPVTLGATTVWERWDSLLPDGSVNEGEMTSFNHYALGAVADWMHRTIGGITPLEPGYAAVRVAPRPGGDLSWARSSLQTRRGLVAVEWHLDGALMHTSVEVPDGVRAELQPGGSDPRVVGSGRHVVTGPARPALPLAERSDT